MNLVSKIILGAGMIALPFLPNQLEAQETQKDTVDTQNYYVGIGLSLQDQHASGFQEYFGTIAGIQFEMGKPIAKEIYGSAHTIYSWGSNKKEKTKESVFEVGPHIIWSPTFGKEKWLYFGGGFKYKTLTVTNKENNEKNSVDGIGLSVLFGSEIDVGEKGGRIKLEAGYDRVSGEFDGEDINLGSTRFSVVFAF